MARGYQRPDRYRESGTSLIDFQGVPNFRPAQTLTFSRLLKNSLSLVFQVA
jgi:hypothetical protein